MPLQLNPFIGHQICGTASTVRGVFEWRQRTGTRREQLCLFLCLTKALLFAVCAVFAGASKAQETLVLGFSVVPAEGIEPPTFGLQNRCSTAELNRQTPF